MIYTFEAQLERGKIGEERVFNWLRDRGAIVKVAPLWMQRGGVDFLVKKEEAKVWQRFEVKTDFKCAETGNVFIEECVEQEGEEYRLGWSLSSEADWFVFYTPPKEELLILKEPVRRAIFIRLKRYAVGDKVRRAENRNYNGSSYAATGFVVPYEKLEDVATYKVKI